MTPTTKSGYWFHRVDTATRVRREELEAQAPGWGGIATDRPQFAILDAPDNTGRPIDWPLLDTHEEAAKDVREFRALEHDDDGARSEATWQARMMGDLSA